MTTREISAHLHEMYEIELSESFVSRAVSSIQEQVNDWQERPLEALYAIVYVDGIRFNVRSENGKIVKKCFYTILGVAPTGKQDVLGLWIADTESASFWLAVLTELKNRGVKDVLIACVDGLNGMPEAIESVFPQADIQLCIVHQIRNCTKFVSYKDRKALCADMKKIYQASSEKAALAALEQLEEKWGKQYPMVINSWKAKWDLLINFIKYPLEIRKMTYTTNSIEALHALFRKNTKNRRVFPNDDSLFRLLYLNIQNLSKKWTTRKGWGSVVNQFSILFGDRISKFLQNDLGE
jgi:transposase-like protein